MLFQIVQMVYWLALSTWFGGVLFIAMSAQVIFRTIRQNNPILPTVLSVNLENQHGTLLSGSIVADLLSMLLKVELICAPAILITLIAQWFTLGQSVVEQIARAALFIASLGIVIYDWRVVSPRVRKYREQFVEHADEPEIANPAKEQFDRYHQESVLLLMILAFVLLGMVLFSADVSRATSIIFSPIAK